MDDMQKIKNRIYGLSLLASLCVFSACNKQLDLAPEDTTVESEVFQSAISAESALMDVYNKTYEANKGTAYVIGDFTTNSLVVTNTSYQTIAAGESSTDSYLILDIWEKTYSAINVANLIIESIPKIGEYNQELENQHVGEAKFLRAYNYLSLLKLFGDGALTKNFSGLGLPLQLVPYKGIEYDSSDALTRSSVQLIYDQIIKDLTDALLVLNEDYDSDIETRSRATIGSVHALLSRVYLYKGDFENAAIEANYLLENYNYSLNSKLRSVFPLSSGYNVALDEEYIYAIPLTFNGGDHQFGTHYYFYRLGNSYYIADEFAAKYTDTDQRKSILITQAASGKLVTSKFNNSSDRDNIPMIRLSEIYLTRAEALVWVQGKNQESVDLLNAIAKRADASFTDFVLSDFSSDSDLINRILLEREKELCFEGLNRYDIIRTGNKLQYRISEGEYGDVNANRYVLPIPKREIDITKGSLEQNPGYL